MYQRENCPEDFIMSDIEECKRTADKHMNTKFLTIPVGSKPSRLPNGCFRYSDPSGNVVFSFNPELDPNKVTPPFDLSYSGVCRSRGKFFKTLKRDKKYIKYSVTSHHRKY